MLSVWMSARVILTETLLKGVAMKTYLSLTFALLILGEGQAFSQEINYEGKPASFYLSLFKDRAASFRLKAIGGLAAIGADDERIVPALLAAVEDPDAEVRTAVVKALGEIGTKGGDKVVPTLKAAANNQFDADVRAAAVRGLLFAQVGYVLVKDIEKSQGRVDFCEPGQPGLRIIAARNWSDAELACLKHLADIKELDLSGTPITNAGMKHLKGLTNLQQLNLWACKIDDAGVAHLANLKNLHELNINATNITNAGLEHFKGLTNLKYLRINDCKANNEGFLMVNKALPNLTIYAPKWDPVAKKATEE